MTLLVNLDAKVFQWINSLAGQSAFRDQVLIFASKYGIEIFGGILFVLFFIHRRSFWRAAIAAVLARVVLVETIRHLYHRPRPFLNQSLEGLRQLIEKNANEASFPSGHAAVYFAIAFAVYFSNKTLGWILLATAGIFGLARVYAGVHYPSDILGGAVVGFISAAVVDMIVRRKY